MRLEAHPIELLPIFDGRLKALSDYSYEFSRYVYVPQTISESRTLYQARASEFPETFREHAASLKPNEEIAMHSSITTSAGERLHIPMIDMGCTKIEPYLPELKSAFGYFDVDGFSVYASGRSFHIYGHGLLKGDHELVRFMGRILLLNLPGKERVIDERWVGHRLLAGYSTLRWTNNNPHYKSLPTRYLLDGGVAVKAVLESRA